MVDVKQLVCERDFDRHQRDSDRHQRGFERSVFDKENPEGLLYRMKIDGLGNLGLMAD
jgi:hypothetical protein